MPKFEDLDSSFDEDLKDEDYFLSDDDEAKVNNLMSQKHVETLKFLRQVLKENKDLRNRIDLIQIELQDSLMENNRPISVNYIQKQTLNQSPPPSLPPILNVINNYIERYDAEIQTEEEEPIEVVVDDHLLEEINSMKKEWEIKKHEFEKELKRVDEENEKLTKDNDKLVKNLKSLNENIDTLMMQINEIKRDKLELNSK